MSTYLQALGTTKGLVPEFVNPKYATRARATLLAPARLECLMQDLAWSLPPSAAVGLVHYPAAFGYFPCKNDIATAARLSAEGVPPYAAATAEMALYNAAAALLRSFGASVPPPVERSFHGVTCPFGPAIALHPSFAPCPSVLRQRLPTPSALRLSARSTLAVKGRGVVIESLLLDGALEINVADAAQLVVKSLAVTNEGWAFDELAPAVMASADCPEVLRMRGYTLRKHAQRRVTITAPGYYVIDGGELQKLQKSPSGVPPPRTSTAGGAAPPPPTAASATDRGRSRRGPAARRR